MPPLHDGMLNVKTSSAMKRWNKRFVVLTQDSILSFFTADDFLKPDPNHQINLAHILRIFEPYDEYQRFEVFFAKRQTSRDGALKVKQISFHATSTREARIWTRRIFAAVQSVHKDISTVQSNLPARKRFSLPFVMTHFGHTIVVGGDDQLTRAFDPHHRYQVRLRSISRQQSRVASFHMRTSSHTILSSLGYDSLIDITQESPLLETITRVLFGEVPVSEIPAKKALLSLIGDDLAILEIFLTLTRTHFSRIAFTSLPGDIGELLRTALHDERFIEILKAAVPPDIEINEMLSPVAIKLRWWMLQNQLNSMQITSSQACTEFAQFLNSFVSGERFTMAAKDATISCLKGYMDDSIVGNNEIKCGEVWKGLLLSTLKCPMDVKNEVFKDIVYLVIDSSFNAETLYSQSEWLNWMLQPILFNRSNDMDKHMRLRMLFLTLMQYHIFFKHQQFESMMVQTLCQLRPWGQDGRIAANAMLECLVAKLQGTTKNFDSSFERIEWSNLIRLLRIIEIFVFCTADWGKSHTSRNEGGRRVSTTRIETENCSPQYYINALEDSQRPNANTQRRFAPIMSESGTSDIVQNCVSLLKSFGFLDPDFLTLTDMTFFSAEAKASCLAARKSAFFFREASSFLLVLELHESCLTEMQVCTLTRNFINASSSTKRLEALQKLSRLPLCEVDAVQMLSGSNRRTSLQFKKILHINSIHSQQSEDERFDGRFFVTALLKKLSVGEHRNQMRLHRDCFSGANLVQILLEEKVSKDANAAILVGIMLLGAKIISPIAEGSIFSNFNNALFRFACHNSPEKVIDIPEIYGDHNKCGLSAAPNNGNCIDFVYEPTHAPLSSPLALDEQSGLCVTTTMAKLINQALITSPQNASELPLLEL